jgi:hypothetical protein
MIRKILSASLMLTLAVAGLDLTAGASQAAHGGGHAVGGFHGGFGGFQLSVSVRK